MKRCYLLVFLVLVGTACGAGIIWAAQPVPDCTLKDGKVEKDIRTVARRLQGNEYCQFRQYVTIDDIDGDGKDDFVVMFTVEGVHGSMNHFLRFVLVYLSSRADAQPVQIQVGERGKRSASRFLRLERNEITVEDDVWQEGDALCCPSGKGQSVYEIKDGKIVKTLENQD